MTANLKKLEAYREQNEQAAKVVLADIAKYGRAESLMIMWARAVVAKASSETADERGAA